MATRRDNETEVAERWQARGDGAHYVAGRWRSRSARQRDPRLVEQLLRRIGPAAAEVESVLDVPCGTGRLRGSVLDGCPRAPRWVGVDVSESMLHQVPPGPGALVRASAADLPFPDRTFDLVVCCRLLHHLEHAESRARIVSEITRVSARFVVASYWDAASYGAWRRRTRGPLRRRKPAGGRQAAAWPELAAAFEAAGARIVARAHSLRFVSQQSFVLAELERPAGAGAAASDRA